MLTINPSTREAAILVTIGVALAAVVVTTWWQKRRRVKVVVPTKWRCVGELVELCIYPLKSGSALHLKEAECTDIGVQTTDEILKLRDRFFVVFEDGGSMKTARQYPKLLKIKVSVGDAGSLIFKAANMDDLTIRIPSGSPKKLSFFKMWKDEECRSVDCGDEAARWMCAYLGLHDAERIRVGYHQDEYVPRRDCDQKPWDLFRKHYRNIMRFDTGAYSDMAPYLLINEASIADLNQRLPDRKQVKASWFRPNFVVRGPEALSEDDWDFVRIGESALFQKMKPCLRCILTTINPETAEKDPDMQPLRTLRSYRLLTDKTLQALEGELAPSMGCYLGLRRPGTVRAGDRVYVGAG